jgi:hypothetical protein
MRAQRPDAFHVCPDRILDAATSILSLTAFPQLSLLLSGKTDRLVEFYAKRWSGMADSRSLCFRR